MKGKEGQKFLANMFLVPVGEVGVEALPTDYCQNTHHRNPFPRPALGDEFYKERCWGRQFGWDDCMRDLGRLCRGNRVRYLRHVRRGGFYQEAQMSMLRLKKAQRWRRW